tara:strand:+ start:114 stop:374 length:261 start_codon:yes stop_codon:yes gene_type:complete
MQIRPLGAVATLDSAAGNMFDNAQSVYVSTTADTTLTLKDSASGSVTIGSMQLVENQSIVIRKEVKEALFATGTATKGTKIAYPRG